VSESYAPGAVARRLGVAVTTLRTWHQRYGLGPSLHEPGQHRRYTLEDVERLEHMQRLVVEGVAPGEAARWVSAHLPVPANGFHERGRRRDGGRAVARAGATIRGLRRAALRLDAPGVRQRVGAAVDELGVVAAWDAVLCPVLNAVAKRHAATGRLVEVEHLLSGVISAVLGAVPRPTPGPPVRVMLACADEEQHSLPLEALAAALAVLDVPCRMFGARVPVPALVAAVQRTGPAALVVWSHLPATGDPAQLTAVIAEHRPPLIVAAGPGWHRDRLPAGVVTPTTLQEAVDLLSSAAG
jgi:MerR family transcriptional regulator, light-induced transcriptional regulator